MRPADIQHADVIGCSCPRQGKAKLLLNPCRALLASFQGDAIDALSRIIFTAPTLHRFKRMLRRRMHGGHKPCSDEAPAAQMIFAENGSSIQPASNAFIY